uniref:Uncharacterized protein n=1 Tax=Chromera velia CCMP2878 TaxID=1169474 RepID=A0A0G4FS72_9ALVE|eukprot:Cvel_18521.t1-p1 / transcript=Cvel_18521.t1 / gene=Cvel_18521 / organism=Chromera_velia_CCMP2878 / gene_product=hypothetical protein / transcript_product=hypothetical protein / location=Cvel_scaffold1539:12127-24400(-) / protein_length=1101 / sequence_SO=supercontig / SO=protein_coding / is_pseudo=false
MEDITEEQAIAEENRHRTFRQTVDAYVPYHHDKAEDFELVWEVSIQSVSMEGAKPTPHWYAFPPPPSNTAPPNPAPSSPPPPPPKRDEVPRIEKYFHEILERNLPKEQENKAVKDVCKIILDKLKQIEPAAVIVPYGDRAEGAVMSETDVEVQIVILKGTDECPNRRPVQLFATDAANPPEGEDDWRKDALKLLEEVTDLFNERKVKKRIKREKLFARASFKDHLNLYANIAVAPATNIAGALMFRRYAELCPEYVQLASLAKLWYRKVSAYIEEQKRLSSYAIGVLVLRYLTEVHPLYQHYTPSLWKDSTGTVLPAGCFYDPVIEKIKISEDEEAVPRITGWKLLDIRDAVLNMAMRPWGTIDWTKRPRDRAGLLNLLRGTTKKPPIPLTRLLYDFFRWMGVHPSLPFRDVLDSGNRLQLCEEACRAGAKTSELLKRAVSKLPPDHPDNLHPVRSRTAEEKAADDLRTSESSIVSEHLLSILDVLFSGHSGFFSNEEWCPGDTHVPPLLEPRKSPLGGKPPGNVQRMTPQEISEALADYTELPFIPHPAGSQPPPGRRPPDPSPERSSSSASASASTAAAPGAARNTEAPEGRRREADCNAASSHSHSKTSPCVTAPPVGGSTDARGSRQSCFDLSEDSLHGADGDVKAKAKRGRGRSPRRTQRSTSPKQAAPSRLPPPACVPSASASARSQTRRVSPPPRPFRSPNGQRERDLPPRRKHISEDDDEEEEAIWGKPDPREGSEEEREKKTHAKSPPHSVSRRPETRQMDRERERTRNEGVRQENDNQETTSFRTNRSGASMKPSPSVQSSKPSPSRSLNPQAAPFYPSKQSNDHQKISAAAAAAASFPCTGTRLRRSPDRTEREDADEVSMPSRDRRRTSPQRCRDRDRYTEEDQRQTEPAFHRRSHLSPSPSVREGSRKGPAPAPPRERDRNREREHIDIDEERAEQRSPPPFQRREVRDRERERQRERMLRAAEEKERNEREGQRRVMVRNAPGQYEEAEGGDRRQERGATRHDPNTKNAHTDSDDHELPELTRERINAIREAEMARREANEAREALKEMERRREMIKLDLEMSEMKRKAREAEERANELRKRADRNF